MVFRNNKNERIEQLGVHITDKKMYIRIYDENNRESYEEQIYDWQLPVLLNLKYIMVDGNEYKINKIFFDVVPRMPELNTIFIYVERI